MSSVTNGDAQPSIIFDSLPYYDNELEQYPILKEKVEKELAREGKPPQTLHPKVPPEPTLFANYPLLQAELERISNHRLLPPLDTTRYQLPGPTNLESEEEWQEALDNAKAQLEHQKLRHSNLALLQQYGANAWRIQNYVNEATATNIERTLEELKNLTVEVNRERKNYQTRLGRQLTSLETRWTELISSILQIELANVALEAEIDQLNQREVDLAAAL
ncbi:breast carcinoma amplified sequence 2 [Dichomitus squalens LYAD-421 SS1]|uniref:breast carcinoma amplified sequence 2 n=1 Tax=Dichomitus squalens (strain LYAD-421) TaxID=732165 RepID=UPI0004411468|nr:breast carcinoma amplified sequence 2 [Dichomitus squalens LYAD-421 SS1]EJF66478.1 breast carcinoma amplified sequence 2 [Dichomitus squalens LYAD-421 SS1]